MRIFILINFLFCITYLHATENIKYVSAKSGLRLRENHDINSKVILTIPYNEKVEIIEEQNVKVTFENVEGKWTKIKYNNIIGWVFGGFLDNKASTLNINGSSDEMILLYSDYRDKGLKTISLKFNNYEYQFSLNGLIQVNNTKYNLNDYDYDISVEKIYYYNYKNNLILSFELSDCDVGWSKLLKFTNKKLIFNNEINGFNLSAGIIENNYIYLTAIGCITKIDLNNGSVIWGHSDLYKKYKNNYSDKMVIIDNNIIINYPKLYNGKEFKIIVNKYTGEIIECISINDK